MALFGLGNFAEGFVGGLAESANKALIEEMDDIKDRVKTVSDYRVKRAVEENEERTEEFNDIQAALKEGADLFGDDPRSMEMAASLLKDQGNLAGYTALINQMRARKNDLGIDPAGFFARAEVDAPASKGYTASDYARSFQGAPKTLPDYRLPEGMVSAGAGNLLSKIGLKPDISGQIQDRTSEQMAAMGVGVDTADLVAMPSIVFRSEDYNLADKSAAEKLKYFTEKTLNPSISEEKREEYRLKALEQAKLAATSADENLRLDGLQTQLASATGEEAASLSKEIIATKKSIERKEAAVSTDPTATLKLDKQDLLLKAADPATPAVEREKILTQVSAIDDEITVLTQGKPTEAEVLKKALEKHQRLMRTNPEYKAGNPEFDEAQAQIDEMREIEKLVGPIDVTQADIRTAEVIIESAVDRAVLNSEMTEDLSPEFLQIYRVISQEKDKDKKRRMVNALSTEIREGQTISDRQAYDEGMATVTSRSAGVIDTAIDVLSQTGRKGAAAAKLAARLFPGYTPPSVDADTGETDTAAADTTVTLPDGFIDTAEAARQSLANMAKDGDVTVDELQDSIQAVEGMVSPEYLNVLKQALVEMTSTDDEDFDQQAEAEKAQGTINKPLEDTVKILDSGSDIFGFPLSTNQIKDLMRTQLGITDEEELEKLYEQATKVQLQNELDTMEQSVKPGNVITLAKILRETQDEAQWKRVIDKYVERTNNTLEEATKRFPAPTQKKAKGGLMARV